MRMGKIAVTVSVAAVTTVLAYSAAAGVASTPAGTGYVAQTSGGHVALILSGSGRQVKRAFIGYTMNCSDGTSFTDFDSLKALPISATRKFKASFDSGVLPDPLDPGGAFQVTDSITGKVNRSRTKITGTVRHGITLKSSKGVIVTCTTGAISYSATH